jgi:hypothetical protein
MARIFLTIWRRWLKIAEILGNIQLVILLTLVYWTMFILVAVPAKFFSDPLSLRNAGRSRWTHRKSIPDVWENLHKQG